MTCLIDPGLPEDHARQIYSSNLVNVESMTYFSDKASAREILHYLLGSYGIDSSRLTQVDNIGTARIDDDQFRLTAVTSPAGAAVTVWTFSDSAAISGHGKLRIG